MSSVTRLALLQRAARAPDLADPGRPARYVPRAFRPLAWACLLLVVAAGVQVRIQEHGSAPRQRTSLRVTKIAYASPVRMGP